MSALTSPRSGLRLVSLAQPLLSLQRAVLELWSCCFVWHELRPQACASGLTRSLGVQHSLCRNAGCCTCWHPVDEAGPCRLPCRAVALPLARPSNMLTWGALLGLQCSASKQGE